MALEQSANKPAMRIVKNDDGSLLDRDGAERSAAESTVCEFCFGTGVEVVPGRGARPCRCQTQDSRRKFLDAARIPRRYANCSLDNFKTEPNSSQHTAL